MQATIVFEKNWNAAHETTESGERKYRYIINSGSSRSSKTYSLIQQFYLYAFANPNKKLAVFRDTKTICKATVFEDMKKAYAYMPNYHLVSLNLTESVFKFPNGSTIHIEGTDDSVKIHGYQSNVIWINEGYDISKDTFDQLDMRCTDYVLFDLNPRQNHWTDEIAKDPRSILIHSTFKDNPFCPPEQKAKILSYQPIARSAVVLEKIMSESEAREYDILSNPKDLSSKQIKELSRCKENESKNSANDFNWCVYGLGLKGERPNRIFHWSPILKSEYDKIDVKSYVGVDWGSVDPMGILEAKYYDGCLYLHELNYDSENKIRERLSPTELAQINTEEEGLVTWLFKKLGISKSVEIVCDTNRPAKISILRRHGWAAYPALKPAGSVIDGIDTLNDLNVFYTSTSENLEYEQENYSRKVDKYGTVLDEPEDLDNHLMDPARYICQFLQAKGIIRRM